VYERKFTYTSTTHTSTTAYAGNVGKRKTHGKIAVGNPLATACLPIGEKPVSKFHYGPSLIVFYPIQVGPRSKTMNKKSPLYFVLSLIVSIFVQTLPA
jgi:hypothetical protein